MEIGRWNLKRMFSVPAAVAEIKRGQVAVLIGAVGIIAALISVIEPVLNFAVWVANLISAIHLLLLPISMVLFARMAFASKPVARVIGVQALFWLSPLVLGYGLTNTAAFAGTGESIRVIADILDIEVSDTPRESSLRETVHQATSEDTTGRLYRLALSGLWLSVWGLAGFIALGASVVAWLTRLEVAIHKAREADSPSGVAANENTNASPHPPSNSAIPS